MRASVASTGINSGIPAFSSETARFRDVRDVCVAGTGRVLRVGFTCSSSATFAPLVRALETCVIFLGESGDEATGALARVCLAGRAANVGFVVAAAGAGFGSCAVPVDCAGATLVVRFGCGMGFAAFVLRLGSGSTVSALFDRVVRLAVASGSTGASCGC